MVVIGARRLVVVLGSSLLVALAVGCGGSTPLGEPVSSDAVDPRRWSDAVEQACEQLDAEGTSLRDEDPTDAAEAVELAVAVEALTATLRDDVARLGPAPDSVAARRFVRSTEALADAGVELRSAARRGDADDAASAVRQLRRAERELDRSARALSLVSCLSS